MRRRVLCLQRRSSSPSKSGEKLKETVSEDPHTVVKVCVEMPRKRKERVPTTPNPVDSECLDTVSEGGIEGDKRPYNKWTKEQEDFILETLYNEIIDGRIIATGSMPKGPVIKDLLLRFKIRFGVDLTMKQLNTKMRLFKRKYATLAKLKNADSGLGWDTERNCFLATPEVMNSHWQSNPEARSLFGRNLWNYTHLETVFGGSNAIREFCSEINISTEDEALRESGNTGNQYTQPIEEVYRLDMSNVAANALDSQFQSYEEKLQEDSDRLYPQNLEEHIAQPCVHVDTSTPLSSIQSSGPVNSQKGREKEKKGSQGMSSTSNVSQSVVNSSIISRLERLMGLDNTRWITAVDNLDGLSEVERVKAYSILQKTDLGLRAVFASWPQERQLLYIKMHL